MDDAGAENGQPCHRRELGRAVLGAGLGLAVLPLAAGSARADDPATELRPQVGDHLVFLTGPLEGKPVRAEDIELGAIQVQAYPADPSGLVRDGSRLNLLILARLAKESLAPETLERSVDGVVAYSGVCTHQACPVNMWSADLENFVCSCHGSTYNPKDGAEVTGGPAPRRLAGLPLKSENGLLIVAGAFTGRVGMQQS